MDSAPASTKLYVDWNKAPKSLELVHCANSLKRFELCIDQLKGKMKKEIETFCKNELERGLKYTMIEDV